MESVVVETLSEIFSLAGVSGTEMDVMLACLDGCLEIFEGNGFETPAGGGVSAAEDSCAGDSVFGVGKTRIVRGCPVRFRGVSCAVVGVADRELTDGVADDSWADFEGVPGLLITFCSEAFLLVVAALISSFSGG